MAASFSRVANRYAATKSQQRFTLGRGAFSRAAAVGRALPKQRPSAIERLLDPGSKHGGRLEAFRKARAYAERLADESRVNPATRRYVRRSPSSGVFRFVNRNRPGKPAMWIAVASPDKGKPQRRYFYVRKYGEKKAARLARQARAAMVRRILTG